MFRPCRQKTVDCGGGRRSPRSTPLCCIASRLSASLDFTAKTTSTGGCSSKRASFALSLSYSAKTRGTSHQRDFDTTSRIG